MKQNERILVYAVTGFLAIILVVAVLFGRDTPANKPTIGSGAPAGNAAPALSELIPRKGAEGTAKEDASLAGQSGLPTPGQLAPEQPLAAPGKTMIAADLVMQALGPYRRDRNVRFVPARAGDSLESLVRRWCGAREPFLDEAACLNEELSVVRIGQEVAVPWVDDEIVYAAFEARKPKTLVAEASVGGAGTPVPAVTNPAVTNPAVSNPGVANPGGLRSVLGEAAPPPVRGAAVAPPAGAGGTPAAVPTAGRTKTYVVRSGDSLWKIAEKLYGPKNAHRMVGEIKKLNPGKTERVLPDQKLVVPETAPAATPGA
jgi:nucleoid-associated protein YgaU